jgi:hypothetical protein
MRHSLGTTLHASGSRLSAVLNGALDFLNNSRTLLLRFGSLARH